MGESFEDTVRRRLTIDQARRERSEDDRRSWFRRKEDALDYERKLAAERRREFRRDLKDWLLIAAVVASLVMGQWDSAARLLGG